MQVEAILTFMTNLFEFIDECADFSNGVGAFGVDQGASEGYKTLVAFKKQATELGIYNYPSHLQISYVDDIEDLKNKDSLNDLF